MQNSLLVNISKYASSHNTSPIENFITEVFAWLLRNDEAARKALSLLLESKAEQSKQALSHLADSDDLQTQVSFGGKYPDLLWNALENDF